MVVFSAIICPLLGLAMGHGYPNGPVFGLTPCPLTIFTFGMLMMTDRTLPKYLVVIPLVWALTGFSAARLLGILEDTGLLVVGLPASSVLLARRRAEKSTSARMHETPAPGFSTP
jgi:hypothetical protein